MSLILPKTCSMGSSKTGLTGTIGVTLLNPDGTTHTARTTAGIYEIGGGCYGKNISFPDNWKGSIKWDTGGGSPVYASEDYIEGLMDMIEEDTGKMNFSGNNIQSRVADKGVLNNPPSETIGDYKANVTNLDVAVSTRNALTPPTVGEIKTELEGAGTKLTLIKTETDKMNFTGDDIKATLDSEEVDIGKVKGGIVSGINDFKNEMNETELHNGLDSYGNKGDFKATGFATPSNILENTGKKVPANLEDVPTDSELDAKHGSGSWETGAGANPSTVADAVWDEKLSDHQKAQTTGYRLKHITGGVVTRPRNIWSVDEKEKVIASIKNLLKSFTEISSKSVNEKKELIEQIVNEITKVSGEENELRDKILLKLADINTLEEILIYEDKRNSSGISKKKEGT